MSSSQHWLQRLGEASDYRQLQAIFTQLAAEARLAGDGSQLVTSIDEAIGRIEQERARDSQELQEFEAQYAEFRSQEAGVLGWFRRHIPFTQTRREERQHKDTIADQHAEILADNLVIARAQMLKQKLLPPERRQLGESSQQWKAKLSAVESMDHIGEYAAVIESLAEELLVSQTFVDKIRADIDAFADARFSSKDDRAQQQQDAEQARAELAEFDAELREEQAMQAAALRRAGELIREQLLLSNHDFYQLDQLLEQLLEARRAADKASEKAIEFVALLEQMQQLSDSNETCATERERLRAEAERLRLEAETAQGRLDKLDRKLAKNAGSGGEGHTHGDTQRQDALQAKHDRTRRELQQLEREISKVESLQQQNRDLDRQLSEQILETTEMIPQTLSEFEPLLNDYLQAIGPLSLQSHVKSLQQAQQWTASASQSDDSARRVQRLVDAIGKDSQELKSEASKAQAERNRIFATHCRKWLGDTVAKLVATS